MKILAVDDDLVARSLLSQALQLAGYSDTLVVDSADSALHQIRISDTRFECFLLDIQMEGMDGIQLCQGIRAMPHYQETPIIMVTAMHEKSSIDAAFTAGATDYITKPFDMLEFGARLRAAEKISDMLAKIRRLGADDIAPKDNANSIPTAPSNVRFADIDQGFVGYADFEEALRHLSKREMMSLSILAWWMPDFQTVVDIGSSSATRMFLNTAAVSVGRAFEAHDFFATYHRDGIYVGAFRDPGPTDGNFVKAQEILNRSMPRQFDSVLPFVEVKFGPAVRFNTLSAEDPLEIVRLELESALCSQNKKPADSSILPAKNTSSVAAQDALQNSLEKLRPYYLATLNEALGNLDILSKKIGENIQEPADIKSVADITHKIAGVAPMLGYEDIGKMAASLETVALEYARPGSQNYKGGVFLSELNRLLDGIENELVMGY